MSNFCKELYCFPVSTVEGGSKDEIEYGGKILLPGSVLETLSSLTLSYPMLFKLTNPVTGLSTHCGVLEFTADENTACLPGWMMTTIGLSSGDALKIETVTLPTATYARFKPQSVIFLDITNPKAVLENNLRRFACLTGGDIVSIKYNNLVYGLRVEETRPGNAVSIIECDMEVDFSPPEGYVEPSTSKVSNRSPLKPVISFKPFSGKGVRLDGKSHKAGLEAFLSNSDDDFIDDDVFGIPDYDYKVGSITYFRNPPVAKKQKIEEFKSFSGSGRQLDDNFGPD